MANNRDEFSLKTKNILANRVGRKCSNPSCGRLTCGPSTQQETYINIGVAAHICAAAKGGERYDANMTSAERKSIDNGIWLCQWCAKMIDTDSIKYTKDILHEWKKSAEEAAATEVRITSLSASAERDKKRIQFFVQCFDRPAFKDTIYQEGCMEDFGKAIQDTQIALNIGKLYTRDGVALKEAESKSAVENYSWRKRLDNIEYSLNKIQRKLKKAEEMNVYTKQDFGDEVIYHFEDRELGEWFDNERKKILKELSGICSEVGIGELEFPKRNYN